MKYLFVYIKHHIELKRTLKYVIRNFFKAVNSLLVHQFLNSFCYQSAVLEILSVPPIAAAMPAAAPAPAAAAAPVPAAAPAGPAPADPSRFSYQHFLYIYI
jgi:hypothetical protein